MSNMSQASDNWTCVTFKPDLAKFGMTELEAETVALMRKRVYDMAGILGKGVKASLLLRILIDAIVVL